MKLLEGLKLEFVTPFDERRKEEARAAGVVLGVHVVCNNKRHGITFYVIERFLQDYKGEMECEWGYGFYFEKNIVILKEISEEEIIRSVNILYNEGFFDSEESTYIDRKRIKKVYSMDSDRECS